MDGLLLIALCAPSGAGKTTLSKHLLDSVEGLRFSVSHTTREPRGEEVDGVDYHFTDRAEFERLIAADRFAEWAEVHGNLYGTCLDEIDRAQRDGQRGLIFDIDYQGARQLRARRHDTISVFVLPPSMRELERRLLSRATDTRTSIDRRLRAAREEISHYGFFDYLVINDDLEKAKDSMRSIVQAELARTFRHAAFAERLLR